MGYRPVVNIDMSADTNTKVDLNSAAAALDAGAIALARMFAPRGQIVSPSTPC